MRDLVLDFLDPDFEDHARKAYIDQPRGGGHLMHELWEACESLYRPPMTEVQPAWGMKKDVHSGTQRKSQVSGNALLHRGREKKAKRYLRVRTSSLYHTCWR
jgi:hypothetical protein